VGVVLLVMESYWSKASFSRAWVGLTFALVLVLELLPRWWWRAYQWRLRMDGRLALRTLLKVGRRSRWRYGPCVCPGRRRP
jgi:hypothetical protein